ncbi:MAG: hypothetical protein ACE366_03520 [Bradymonadia bacterium]
MRMHSAMTVMMSLLGATIAQGKTTPIEIDTIRAPNPPHCMSEQQWSDPDADGPLNLFDGDLGKPWVLCQKASDEPDYAIDVRFKKPITIDQLRIQLASKAHPIDDHSVATQVEVAFLRSDLSSIPIFFRTLELNTERNTLDLNLKGTLKWSPNLIDDPEFGARRQAKGYDEYDIPAPLTVDGMVLVVRRQDRKAQPLQIAEMQMWFEEARLPVKRLVKSRKAHRGFLQQGLQTVLKGNYLVSKEQVLGFAPDGRLWQIAPQAWKAGVGYPRPGQKPSVPEPGEGEQALPLPKLLGPWQIKNARLEVFHRRKFVPVRYLIDDAPALVKLEGGAIASRFEVQVSPPRQTAGNKARPSLGSDPLADPPLLDDPDDEDMIPIP